MPALPASPGILHRHIARSNTSFVTSSIIQYSLTGAVTNILMEKDNPRNEHVLDQWRLAMAAQSLSQTTITERIRVVGALSRDTSVTALEMKSEDIVSWLAQRPSASTKWSYYTHLNAFYRWALRMALINKNPLDVIPAPKKPKSTPRPIPTELITTVLSSNLHIRTRAMIVLAYYEGLRTHEIAKIRGADYDPLTTQLTILGKGGKMAFIAAHPKVQEIAKQMPQHGFWFPAYVKAGHISPKSVGYTIKTTFERHGITMTAHQLRHSFGTDLVAKGVNLRVVQTLMRHESIQSTAIYTQVTNAQQQLAIENL